MSFVPPSPTVAPSIPFEPDDKNLTKFQINALNRIERQRGFKGWLEGPRFAHFDEQKELGPFDCRWLAKDGTIHTVRIGQKTILSASEKNPPATVRRQLKTAPKQPSRL